jgi:hypothetical protein
MPLTLTLTENVLPTGTEKVAFAKLSDAMLRCHGLTGNKFMTPNVIGSINVIPSEHTFSGLVEAPVVFVEWKVPSFAFTSREVQEGYIAEATQIIHDLSGGKQPKENIWVNVVHAVDGAWGIAGKAYTNVELGEAATVG